MTEPGDSLQIPYQLDNRGTNDHSHLSLFVGSPDQTFAMTEVLIGTVGRGQSTDGIIEIPVPTWWPAGALNLRIGVAQDAWPIEREVINRKVVVNARSVAELELSVDVVDESSGNRLDSVVSNQRAALRITLRNHGLRTARAISLRYHNLAGEQLHLSDPLKKFPDLVPGEDASIEVPFTTGQTILTDHLALGIQVESRDLLEAVHQQFKLRATANPSIEGSRAPDSLTPDKGTLKNLALDELTPNGSVTRDSAVGH